MKETFIVIALIVLLIIVGFDLSVQMFSRREAYREGYRKGRDDERMEHCDEVAERLTTNVVSKNHSSLKKEES